MKMEFDKFKWYIGNIIFNIQTIENDIKLIFAHMKNARFDETLQKISKWTFGKIVSKLKLLDYSDSNNLFSKSDYNYLKQMANKRNHWAHETFLNFIYIKNWQNSNEYNHECDLLLRDNERLVFLADKIEEIRLNFCKKNKR